jgi:hypothetical protein
VALLESTTANAWLSISTADISVCLTYALELCAQVDALPAYIECKTVCITRNQRADNLLIAVVNLVILVVVLIDDVTRLCNLTILWAVCIYPVSLLLCLNKTETLEKVE